MDSPEQVEAALVQEAPAWWQLLSPLGRRAGSGLAGVAYGRRAGGGPAGLAGWAPGRQVGDGAAGLASGLAEPGGPADWGVEGEAPFGRDAAAVGAAAVFRERIAATLAGLAGEAAEVAAALAESPPAGWPELRRLWRQRQRRGVAEAVPSSLPLVTAGLSHGLSLVADLFAGPGTAVAVPAPFWGNYRHCFAVRNGGRLLTAPAYREGRFDPGAVGRALAALPAGEPAIALVNLPSNPGGYAPPAAERRQLLGSLLAEANRRPLAVVCDDAYAGLVYDPEVPRRSLFWDLAGVHPNLAAIKVDGATKEVCFFGGRVGFLTFGAEPGSPVAKTLERKVAALISGGIGAPASASQAVLLAALRDASLESQVEVVRLLLEERYRALRQALAAADPERVEWLPFNAGCFALVEVPARLGIGAAEVRRHLLARCDTGLVSIAPRYLRIAHCSVDAGALPELVRRLENGIGELAARR
jgi:aspartate/methionine/tyrosine aminotransferase